VIFNLFKSKPTLKELIPKDFIDIHSHILPGIDDGPKNIKESLVLISKMEDLGFSKIISTPHTYPGLYNNSKSSITKSYNSLMNVLKSHIEISFATEYMIEFDLVKKSDEKSLLTLDNKHVLLEFGFYNTPNNFHEILFSMLKNGYVPIVAHPERYLYLENNFKLFYKLRDIGCKFQINLISFTGYYGKNVLKLANKLIDNNLIDFVGSDIHNIGHIKQFDEKIKTKNVEKVREYFENNLIFI
tara:strand:- start:1743 stop:2471 length:729 start_codon:yes stop_codon:yes gene_type:complete